MNVKMNVTICLDQTDCSPDCGVWEVRTNLPVRPNQTRSPSSDSKTVYGNRETEARPTIRPAREPAALFHITSELPRQPAGNNSPASQI